jgi:hypothetical protein
MDSLGPLPRIWFEIASLTPAERFRQRHDAHGYWLPPRPRGSNVKGPTSWFEYMSGQTTSATKPPTRQSRKHYKTYSFHTDRSRIFIYPSDACVKQVGDGSGNPKMIDWRELSFHWMRKGDTITSQVTCVGKGISLHKWYSDRGQHQELLPARYHANSNDPSDTTEQLPSGGLTGELPVLVALIVLSVPSQDFKGYLESCMGAKYRPHGAHREQACELSK